VVSKDDLIKAIRNGRSVSDAALTTRLNVARSAIGDSGDEQRLIKTLPRKGFRFVGQVQAQGPAGATVTGNLDEEPKPEQEPRRPKPLSSQPYFCAGLTCPVSAGLGGKAGVGPSFV
jgi:DNA-binding winged helix-turn-helix (wHTH) protein